MRRRVGMTLCAAVAMLGGLVSIGIPALAGSAQSLDDAGWWWRAKQGPLTPVAPTPPATSEGQLMVQGAPDEASAIAAVRATLPEGDGNPVLTLKVAANGDSGGAEAILLACQAGAAWSGGEGALQWEAKPLTDCTKSVQGQRSADGTMWVFPLGALQFNDQINVVLVPGRNPSLPSGANGSVFQLIFDKPTAASVTTTSQTAPDDFGGDFGGGFQSYDGGDGQDGVGDAFTPTFSPSGFGTPPVEPSLAPADQGRSAIAPTVQARNPVPVQPISAARSGSARALGFLVLLMGAAGSWWFAQQEAPAPRKLGRFASAQPIAAPAPTEVQVGGLGRFARPRTSTPRRLS